MAGERRGTLRRAGLLVAALATSVLILSGAALAATVVGTGKNDVLRGTAKADKLLGKGGNDKLYGKGGNDVLVGGAGKDMLVGGPGADKLQCGAGRDTAQADAADQVGADCELVQGPVLPSVSVAGAAVDEGNSGSTNLSFPVTLSKPVTWAVSVNYATADGSAKAPTDYASSSGSVTFAPGETSKTIAVAVKGDTEIEPDETLTVNLSSPVNTTIATGSATGTIENEDKPKPRSGHWSGTTSQNRPIGFDVTSESTAITNMRLEVDVQCQEIDFRATNVVLDFGSSRFGLKPDWSFSAHGSDSDSNGTIDISLSGYLTPGGSATGHVQVDFGIYTDYGTVHCSTGDVTWTAS
jgi:hypothetical protein